MTTTHPRWPSSLQSPNPKSQFERGILVRSQIWRNLHGVQKQGSRTRRSNAGFTATFCDRVWSDSWSSLIHDQSTTKEGRSDNWQAHEEKGGASYVARRERAIPFSSSNFCSRYDVCFFVFNSTNPPYTYIFCPTLASSLNIYLLHLVIVCVFSVQMRRICTSKYHLSSNCALFLLISWVLSFVLWFFMVS